MMPFLPILRLAQIPETQVYMACIFLLHRPASEATDSQRGDSLPGVQVCGGQLRLQEGRQDPQGSQQRERGPVLK